MRKSTHECFVRGNELVICPVKETSNDNFAEQILADLINQGYSGNELLEEFKKAQKKVRPAVEAILDEAEQAAAGKTEYCTYEDLFD